MRWQRDCTSKAVKRMTAKEVPAGSVFAYATAPNELYLRVLNGVVALNTGNYFPESSASFDSTAIPYPDAYLVMGEGK